MKCTTWFAALAGLTMSVKALALGSMARVAVVDRDTGAQLSTYYHRGEYWVAGKPGSRYAIQIRNCVEGRLLAVTSVDGVNVISGATAGWGQSGYVFDPGADYQITGWRKSDTEVAAFTFTASPNSYAERTGRPANVGVIGIALFRERPTPPVRITQPSPLDAARAEESARAAASEPGARSAGSAGALSEQAQDRVAAAPLPAPKLGTGHGERETSVVENTEFRRMQPEPNEVIRIRYDSYENLLAMGVVRPPRATPPAPNAFPVSQHGSFVPDPPGSVAAPALVR